MATDGYKRAASNRLESPHFGPGAKQRPRKSRMLWSLVPVAGSSAVEVAWSEEGARRWASQDLKNKGGLSMGHGIAAPPATLGGPQCAESDRLPEQMTM
ncbi:hypothetical protein E4U31_003440 [Claviceps sp. LM219 group G6]|nr:hypothetical protein E4U31_003440 [Claviceps sp. LM219 group G6]